MKLASLLVYFFSFNLPSKIQVQSACKPDNGKHRVKICSETHTIYISCFLCVPIFLAVSSSFYI